MNITEKLVSMMGQEVILALDRGHRIHGKVNYVDDKNGVVGLLDEGTYYWFFRNHPYRNEAHIPIASVVAIRTHEAITRHKDGNAT